MRILFLSHYFPPEVNAPATRTYDHCVRWAREGHEVTVVTCAPNCPDGVVYSGYRNRLWPQSEIVDGIRVIRVWTVLAPNKGALRRIVNFLAYMVSAVLTCLWVRRPDVVIATSPQFFCGWAGVFVSWLRWRPFVLEIRDIWPESIEVVGAMRRGAAIRILEWLERILYRAANQIVTVGSGYRDKIVAKAPVENRISVIMNGVDLDLFPSTPADPRFLHQWNLEGKFVCSYIGTIGMAHGLEVVIRAAKLLKEKGRDDIAFCLVGDGAARESLEQMAKAEGVLDRVAFTGRLPKDEMPFALASSDVCLIHLRKCELFGTVIPSKIFETMAMNRPMIMGVEGEARAIVKAAGAGIDMEPESADSLVACLEQLTDPMAGPETPELSPRAFVAEHFTRDATADRFLDLLHSVAGLERTPVPELVTAEFPAADPASVS